MLSAVHSWRRDPSVRFEWNCLHACRPIPLGALPVWMGVAVYVVLITYPWAHAPLLSSVGLRGSLGGEMLLKASTPLFWACAFAFWFLPWAMFERRILYRTSTPADLEKKTNVLIRLFFYALLFYPLIRLGYFGVSQIALRTPPSPTLIDLILFDTSRPILFRYVFTLGVALTFALYTLSMVVLRLRLAQWATLRAHSRAMRFVAYAIPSVTFALLLFPLKRNVYNELVPFVMGEGGMPGLFISHYLPWVAFVVALSFGAAHLVHRANRTLAAGPNALRA